MYSYYLYLCTTSINFEFYKKRPLPNTPRVWYISSILYHFSPPWRKYGNSTPEQATPENSENAS